MKKLWAVLVCLLWCSSVQAQDEKIIVPKAPNILAGFYVDAGVSRSSYNDELPPQWQKNFLPPGGTMKLSSRSTLIPFRLGGGIEPVVPMGRFRLGFPVEYSLGYPMFLFFWTFTHHEVASTQTDWWDPVVVQDRKILRTSPSLGVSLSRGLASMVVSAQKYRTYVQDYEGVDCFGCVNGSKKLGAPHGVSEGTAIKVLLAGQVSNTTQIGFFFERISDKYWVAGIRTQRKAGLFHRPKKTEKKTK